MARIITNRPFPISDIKLGKEHTQMYEVIVFRVVQNKLDIFLKVTSGTIIIIKLFQDTNCNVLGRCGVKWHQKLCSNADYDILLSGQT